MVPSNQRARGLQQQPVRDSNRQQQQAGSSDFQPRPAAQPGKQQGDAGKEGRSHSQGER